MQTYQPTILRDGKLRDVSDNEVYHLRVKKCFDHFAERTTLGTVIFMKEAVRWWYKLFWILIFLGGVCASAYNVYLLIDEFFQYPVNTQVTLSYEKLPFPSITVCNINPVRKSAVEASGVSPALNQFASQLMPVQAYKYNYMSQPNAFNSYPPSNITTNSNNSNPPSNITTNSTDLTKLENEVNPLVVTNLNIPSLQQNSTRTFNSSFNVLNSLFPVLETAAPLKPSTSVNSTEKLSRRKVHD